MLSRPCRCTIVLLFYLDSFSYSVTFVGIYNTYAYIDVRLSTKILESPVLLNIMLKPTLKHRNMKI